MKRRKTEEKDDNKLVMGYNEFLQSALNLKKYMNDEEILKNLFRYFD